MKITFALKQFFKDKKANARQVNHFLLDDTTMSITLVFTDSSKKSLSDPDKDSDGKYVLDLNASVIPDVVVGGATHKKEIARLSMDFSADIKFGGRYFELLRIQQDFLMTPLPTNSDLNIDYQLTPAWWTHNTTNAKRTASMNTHPLLDLRNLAKNEIGLNALVVDLTELWDHLHKKNVNYRIYKELTEPGKVTFKVFAHLGGNAFIWFGVVPSYLSAGGTMSPHIFYQPSDWAQIQNIEDEEEYLFRNETQFEARTGSRAAYDGDTLLMSYLLPPTDDVKISKLNPTDFDKASFIEWVTKNRRNVVNFQLDAKKVITPQHWNIGAGFERAFYGLGKAKPRQILLMPQVVVAPKDVRKRQRVTKGSESTTHVKNITDAIFDLLQTHTELFGKKNELIIKDKMILSCYSESGEDLWSSSKANADHIKAIIGIEPNSTNPRGARIIPTLLDKKIKVFLIGQHEGFDDFYRPKIAASLLKQIRFMPDEPLKMLKYPPNPDINDFVKYRVARVTSETLDPFLLPDEKAILKELAGRKKPVTGKAVIPEIFKTINNSYDQSLASLTNIFYTHHFALSGGQEMTLADPDNFYNKPVTYRTFFQQAVEEIG